MGKEEIYNAFSQEIFFYLLKKVKEKNIAKDILQNTFLKAYENLHQIKQEGKTKAWLFQISRNEVANYYKRASGYVTYFEDTDQLKNENNSDTGCTEPFCCFDHFIDELPGIYKDVVELVFKNGKKQAEAADILNINLPTVKARIRRAKFILKEQFCECCQYSMDENGQLMGEPNCTRCHAIL